MELDKEAGMVGSNREVGLGESNEGAGKFFFTITSIC